MNKVVILQRLVPHYRVKLFERLYRELGWVVACAEKPPRGTGLHVGDSRELPFLRSFPYKFFDSVSPFCAIVPLSRILAELKPEAIISEFSLRMTSTWELAGRRAFGRLPKVLFWTQGLNYDVTAGSIHEKISTRLRKIMFRLVDGQIYYTQECMIQMNVSTPGFVATNTLDIEELRSTPSANIDAKFGKPLVLSIGRMTVDKGFPLVVKGFVKFLHDFPDATLVLIGDGPDRIRVEREAGPFLGKNIVLTGAIFDESTLAYYFRKAQLCIIGGAAGLSVNHALAYGVPVMAFRGGRGGPHHHPEFAFVKPGITGWIVDEWSSDALASTLRTIFQNGMDSRNAMSRSLTKFVDDHLTLDAMLEGFRAVDRFLSSSKNATTGRAKTN
jgi:glycosyltransferase involved in cell wall biosynthesis